MEEVTLIPKKAIDIKLEADVITPYSFAGKSAEQIGELSVWQCTSNLSQPRPSSLRRATKIL
jgi:formylmethanofuran dehydrogenase subunit C